MEAGRAVVTQGVAAGGKGTLFIFPTIFSVVLGPVVINFITTMMKQH